MVLKWKIISKPPQLQVLHHVGDYEWKKMVVTELLPATDLTGPAPFYTATVAAGADIYF